MSATEVQESHQSLGELFGELGSELGDLVTTQLELAKVEIKDEVRDAGRAGAMFGAAAVAGHTALLMLSFAAAWGLAEVMPAGLAFLLVGLVYAAVAAIVFVQGRNRMREVDAVPPQTAASLKEDVQWARRQRS